MPFPVQPCIAVLTTAIRCKRRYFNIAFLRAPGWSYDFNGATTQDAMADVGSGTGNDAWDDYLNLNGMGEWIVMYSPRVYSALFEAQAETATALAELAAGGWPCSSNVVSERVPLLACKQCWGAKEYSTTGNRLTEDV